MASPRRGAVAVPTPGWAQEEEARAPLGAAQVRSSRPSSSRAGRPLGTCCAEFYYERLPTPSRTSRPCSCPRAPWSRSSASPATQRGQHVTFFLGRTARRRTNTPLGSTFAGVTSSHRLPAAIHGGDAARPSCDGNLRNVSTCRPTWTDISCASAGSPGTAPSPPPGRTFTDVPVGTRSARSWRRWSRPASRGAGPAHCPDAAVTRGQMAVFLSVALGLPGRSSAGSSAILRPRTGRTGGARTRRRSSGRRA